MFSKVQLCLFMAAVAVYPMAAMGQTFTAEVQEPTGEVFPMQALQEIVIDDLVIDYKPLQAPQQDLRTNLQPAFRNEWRLYGPGQAHWGNAKFTSRLGGSKELQAWWQEAAKGKNIRKNITVTLYKSNKQAGRSYTLFDCFPQSYEFDTSSTVQTETLTVNIGRIEFKTLARASGTPNGGGIAVSLDGAAPDTYKTWGDGEPELILTGAQPPSKFRTNSPGHKTVGEITLRGAMTDGRKALCDWINDTVNGKPWKRMLTITELLSVDGSVKDGKQYIYHDCFPCRYVFPRMSVTNTTGNVMEEVAIKPIRVELK